MNLDLKRAYEAAEEIAAARTEITLPLLKAFSSLVMRNTGALYRTSRGEYDEAKGDLRLQNVSAGRGGRSYLSWEKVEPRTNDFIVWLNERLASIGSMAAPDIYDLSFEAHFRLVSGVSPPVGKKVGRCRNKDLQEVVELHVVDVDVLGDILDEAGEQGRERCPEREYHDSDNDVEPPVQAHECLHLARVSFRERRVEGVVQDERKGWAYAWEAIQTAHDEIEDLSVRMFGTYRKPPSMPP